MKQTINVLLENIIRQAFNQALIPADYPILLTEATKAEFGDYQANGVMKAAKLLGKNPRDLAALVIELIDKQDIIEKLEVAGPGFINVTLADAFLASFVEQLNSDNNYGVNYLNHDKQTVVVDYSSPNLAKEMHVGHLRSTVIGDALYRILSYMGDRVIRQNHVGDWGTQFGMLIAYMQELNGGNEHQEFTAELSDLEEFYRKAKTRYDTDEEFQKRARHCVVVLQNSQEYGEEGQQVYRYWQDFTQISLTHCLQIYAQLGALLTAHDVAPESMYNKELPAVIESLERQQLLTLSDGAKCIFFGAEEQLATSDTPFIVQKQDGGFLYATTDLAALNYRCHVLNASRLIYVVDARQSLHFKQLFSVAKQASFAKADTELQHIEFGTMMAEDGKPFKTRTGGTVKLIDLINEAQKRALNVASSKNSDLDDNAKQQLATTLAIAAIKYADLSKNRSSDYIFSFDKMLSFDGNTAPYLLYAYTRIKSLLTKVSELGLDLNSQANNQIILVEAIEHRLALTLARFSDSIAITAKECYPHYLCQYLYNLSGVFMQFYENCAVIKESNSQLVNSRLLLVKKVGEILATGLNLLGITTVNRM